MKIKQKLAVVLLALISVFTLSACCLTFSRSVDTVFTVYAAETAEGTEQTEEETTEPTEPTTEGQEEEVDNETIAANVKEYLQSIYGDDYETYYNQIIENWGSVEKYLLSASENLPEEHQYKVTELITKINTYIGVAADGVLLLCVGIYIICRARKNKKVQSDLDRLKTASNQTQSAELAIMSSLTAHGEALKQLMPNQKFETATTAITEAETELTAAKEELNKNV